MKILLYDTTLREGVQGVGASMSVMDKMRLIDLLDHMGVSYIEVGNPAYSPKDEELYRLMSDKNLSHAKLTAFGATCRVNMNPQEDEGILGLLKANTPAVCIFGKAWDFHVTDVLRATLEENLAIIRRSVGYLKSAGKEMIFDAEHFFDGYKENPDYALKTLEAAHRAGADMLCLCDTNGGCFPDEVFDISQQVVQRFGSIIGIHCHNDTGMAAANTVMGVKAGVRVVQTTLNGIGERCGNADMFTVAPNLQIKLGYDCIPNEAMQNLMSTSRIVGEIFNIKLHPRAPYVGRYSFSHKAGMHIDAVSKNPKSFEHVPPESVGNERKTLISEMSGQTAIINRISEFAPDISEQHEKVREILKQLKKLEQEGYQFEGADASFEILVNRIAGREKQFFELIGFKTFIMEPAPQDQQPSSVMIELVVDGKEEITAATGIGPVDALDKALRKALERFYPCISEMRLTDYKVRVLDPKNTTASQVRVLIESSNGKRSWTTVGVSADVIEASWIALHDSIIYLLSRQQDFS
ncbi:MAG: citramalate synthase [Christensenellales bacterium]